MRNKREYKQEHQKLLHRAKSGNSSAKKKLRHLGLLYWEHKGRVIVKEADHAVLKG